VVGLCEAKSERQHVVYQDKKSDQALDDDDDDDDRKKRMGHFIISSSSFDSIQQLDRRLYPPTSYLFIFLPCLSLSLSLYLVFVCAGSCLFNCV
jgi:hypothetical protein